MGHCDAGAGTHLCTDVLCQGKTGEPAPPEALSELREKMVQSSGCLKCPRKLTLV